MNQKEPKEMNDEELAEATRKAAGHVSYYNAAEGQCWYDETNARGHAKARFFALSKECRERSLDWNPKKESYLL